MLVKQKATYAGYEAAWSTDTVHMKAYATGTLRYQCTLLQGVVNAFNAVFFHRQQKTTAANNSTY